MRTNTLSAFGRMSYGAHMLVYPSLLAAYVYGIAPYMERQKAEADQKEFDSLAKAKTVDPDLFSPFTPIPYHNNPELRYVFAHINMRNYINKNHINEKEYVWKNYHNSFDHNDQKSHLYNWVPK